MEDDVYRIVRLIPKDYVSTYGEIAKQIGRPKAYRAVGTVLRNNKYPYEFCSDEVLRVPCHRVVKSDGGIGGFFGATDGLILQKKIDLLDGEGVKVNKGNIVDFKNKLYKFE